MGNNITRRPNFSWEHSVWFFDVDDTLIDTAGSTISAAEVIQKVFQHRVASTQAKQLRERFVEIFVTLMKGHQGSIDSHQKHDDLVTRITAAQPTVLKKYGFTKKWSREIFIKLAAEDLMITVTPELIHEAADAYWITLSKQTRILPGVSHLLEAIKGHHRPIYLITSSDARLKMQDDGTFIYSPEYSEGLKRERMELLREKGITYNGLSIGDPEDKPHRDFFEKGIKIAEKDLGRPVNPHNVIMVGDSFSGDLQTPKEKMGFGIVVLSDSATHGCSWIDDHQLVTNNLGLVPEALS